MARAKSNLSISEFSERLCADALGADIGRVACKFVHSMLLGISRARSVNLTDIAAGLDESIRLHATHKRLSRNLEDPALSADLSDRLLKLGAEQVGPDTRLIIHLYDLNKKYANKIEFLSKSADLPDAGFKVCEILASETGSNSYIPLLAHVWSDQVPGYASDADEVRKSVLRVQAATNNRGMFYVDDHSLHIRLLSEVMDEPNLDYISLVRGNELELLYKNECCSVLDLLERVETRYGKIIYKLVPEGIVGVSKIDLDLFAHVGAASVKLLPSNRPGSFIALKTDSSYLGENATPIITSKVNLRSRKALMGLVDAFLSIQDIVETHQTRRDSFNPANFRVLTYHRLQLLMTLLEAVIHYEVSVQGNVLIQDRRFAPKPHDGEVDRTYLLPEEHKAAKAGHG
ncbi:MAG: hypothetical protein ACR2PJ_03865 [Pseudomonadales bacterium]